MSVLDSVDDRLRVRLLEAGLSFGLGELISASRAKVHSFHSVFRCEFMEGTYAIKQLVRRPDLPRWRDRFECAFAVESWLSRGHSFLPTPIANLAGEAISVIPSAIEDKSADWFIAHQWINGEVPDLRIVTERVFSALGFTVASVAQVALGLVSVRSGMDDEIPSVEEVIELLERWQPLDALVVRQCDKIKKAVSILESIHSGTMGPHLAVVGHSDLSPTNIILANSGALFVLDWENVGLSTLESEIGRVLVHWCMGQPGCPPIGVEHVFRGLGASLHAIDEVSDSWFSSWLSGHLMFLRYLLVSANRCEKEDALPARVKTEVGLLAEFVEKMPRLLGVMREAMIGCGWAR